MIKQTQTKQLPKGWKEIPLSEVLDYEQPNSYIVHSEILEEKTPVPVLTANKGFIRGYTNEKEGIYKNLPAIIFDDFTTNIKYVDFPFKVKSSAMKILKSKNNLINLKFVFYQMLLKEVNSTTHKRYYLSAYQKLKVIFPFDEKGNIILKEQEKIVQEIESKLSILKNIEDTFKKSLNKSKLLKKSILKSAFEGKLVKTEEMQK